MLNLGWIFTSYMSLNIVAGTKHPPAIQLFPKTKQKNNNFLQQHQLFALPDLSNHVTSAQLLDSNRALQDGAAELDTRASGSASSWPPSAESTVWSCQLTLFLLLHKTNIKTITLPPDACSTLSSHRITKCEGFSNTLHSYLIKIP